VENSKPSHQFNTCFYLAMIVCLLPSAYILAFQPDFTPHDWNYLRKTYECVWGFCVGVNCVVSYGLCRRDVTLSSVLAVISGPIMFLTILFVTIYLGLKRN